MRPCNHHQVGSRCFSATSCSFPGRKLLRARKVAEMSISRAGSGGSAFCTREDGAGGRRGQEAAARSRAASLLDCVTVTQVRGRSAALRHPRLVGAPCPALPELQAPPSPRTRGCVRWWGLRGRAGTMAGRPLRSRDGGSGGDVRSCRVRCTRARRAERDPERGQPWGHSCCR